MGAERGAVGSMCGGGRVANRIAGTTSSSGSIVLLLAQPHVLLVAQAQRRQRPQLATISLARLAMRSRASYELAYFKWQIAKFTFFEAESISIKKLHHVP
eukprot:3891340-Pleurochrysis_carterae.AAC.3